MAVTRGPLRQLIRQADSVAEGALTLTWRTLDTLRGKLVRMIGKKENLAGSAAARGVFYKAIQAECRLLSERINTLQQKLIKSAGIGAAKAAAKTTGLKVEYSEKRAKAIAEIVTPAQGKNLAAVFTENMSERMIKSLREATVQSIREQGAAGGTLKDQSHDLAAKWQDILGKGKPVFVDSAGKMWDASRYLQMNTRTNAMRVYNDCLADDIARVSPSDHPLARISADGDPHCDCAAWEGIIISLDGKDSRFPSYDDARLGGCFHPNCVHTLEYVDEVADADEIKIQGKHPVGDVEDWDAMDERKYQIDQERYKERGLNADEARLEVDRDNLTDSIRNGLVTASARSLVDALTPEQVTKLCKDGNPPEFEPIKLTKRERARMSEEEIGKLEKWNHGTYGGVVHIDRENLTTEKLVKVCKLDEMQAAKADTAKTKTTKPENVNDSLHSHAWTESDKTAPIRNILADEGVKAELDRIAKNVLSKATDLDADESRKKLEELKKEFDRINKELKAVMRYEKRMQRVGREDDWQQMFDDVIAKQKDAENRKQKITEDYTEKVIENIKLFGFEDASGKISAHHVTGRERLDTFNQIIGSLFNGELIETAGMITRLDMPDAKGRSFCMTNDIKVFCKESFSYSSTMAHEYAHFLEGHIRHVNERCREFLEARTQGETLQSLKRLTQKDYEDGEMTRPDNFMDPYCGKHYQFSTEILSMGVQWLAENPKKFYNTDPEHFRFTLGVIRGLL